MQMYFIAIVLPQTLDEKIVKYKKWMAENYSCKVGLKSPAHITIAPPFWMNEELQQVLADDIERISDVASISELNSNHRDLFIIFSFLGLPFQQSLFTS